MKEFLKKDFDAKKELELFKKQHNLKNDKEASTLLIKQIMELMQEC